MLKISDYHLSFIDERYDFLTVKNIHIEKTRGNKIYYTCECICGNYCVKRLDQLTSKGTHRKSCGCKTNIKEVYFEKRNYKLLDKHIDYLHLYALDEDRMVESKRPRVYYIAKCVCGKEFSVRGDYFNQKNRMAPYSCGCKNTIDMVGKKYNKLTVIEELPPAIYNTNRSRLFRCLCDCGNTYDVTYPNLVNSATKSCDKCRLQDITGKKYGLWTVLEEAGNYVSPKGHVSKKYKCVCICGNIDFKTSSGVKAFKNSGGGCLSCLKKSQDITGKKYGLLTPRNVDHIVTHPSGQYSKMWLCDCICGKETVVSIKSILSGDTISCGCLTVSKGEIEVARVLDLLGITYLTEFRIKECRNKRPLPFDFCIKNNSGDIELLIEYDGIQHFVKRQGKRAEKNFESLVRNDNIKNEFCKDNNIKLLRIPYWDFNNIEDILRKELKES